MVTKMPGDWLPSHLKRGEEDIAVKDHRIAYRSFQEVEISTSSLSFPC